MNKKSLLLIDAVINLILGIILLAFSPFVIKLFGIPSSESYFYPNVLGGVFIGITIALIIEAFGKDPGNNTGLGLTGAVCINICGGIVLLLWLLSGDLDIPAKGTVFLWILDIILLMISTAELLINLTGRKNTLTGTNNVGH